MSNSMGFIAEALDLIQRSAVTAAGSAGKVTILQPAAEPEHVYYTVDSAGALTQHIATPPPRSETLVGLDDLVRYVERATDSEDDVVVWVARHQIVVVRDDQTRRDRATLSLELTPQAQRLVDLGRRALLGQRDFVRLLRVDLAGCLNDGRLLEWVRNVRFSATANTAGQVRQQRESLGRDIEQEAIGEGECPDEVTLSVRLFRDPSLRETRPIRCAVEILLAEQQFALTPLPQQLPDAIDHEIAGIAERLDRVLVCPVFRGMP